MRNGDVVEVRAACRKSRRRSGWEGRCSCVMTRCSRAFLADSAQLAGGYSKACKAPLAALGSGRNWMIWKEIEAWWYQAAITGWLCSTVTASEALCVLFLSARGILISLVGLVQPCRGSTLGPPRPSRNPSFYPSINHKRDPLDLPPYSQAGPRACIPKHTIYTHQLGTLLVRPGMCVGPGSRDITCTAYVVCTRLMHGCFRLHLHRWMLNRPASIERDAVEEDRCHQAG